VIPVQLETPDPRVRRVSPMFPAPKDRKDQPDRRVRRGQTQSSPDLPDPKAPKDQQARPVPTVRCPDPRATPGIPDHRDHPEPTRPCRARKDYPEQIPRCPDHKAPRGRLDPKGRRGHKGQRAPTPSFRGRRVTLVRKDRRVIPAILDPRDQKVRRVQRVRTVQAVTPSPSDLCSSRPSRPIPPPFWATEPGVPTAMGDCL
jgi:hypothetical protein